MKEKHKNANKRLHKFAFALLLVLSLASSGKVVCQAEGSIEAEIDTKIEDVIDDFHEAVPDGVGDIDSAGDISERLGVKRILAEVLSAIGDNSGELISLLLTLIGIGLMSALSSLSDKELSSPVSSAVGIVSAALLFDRLFSLMDGVIDSLSEINAFFSAVIPISLTVNSLGASPTTATAQAMGMGMTLGAYSFVAEKLLGGVVAAVFVTSALSSVDPKLSRLSRSVKNLFLGLLGIVTVLIGATFTLQSTISASADSVAIRSARYAISGAIPIVGNTVSGAFGFIVGGVQYARSVIGGGAIAVIISLILAPLVTLLAYRFCLKLGMDFCSWCSLGGAEGVFASFFGALDMLIAVYTLTSAVYITELAAFLKGGAGIA